MANFNRLCKRILSSYIIENENQHSLDAIAETVVKNRVKKHNLTFDEVEKKPSYKRVVLEDPNFTLHVIADSPKETIQKFRDHGIPEDYLNAIVSKKDREGFSGINNFYDLIRIFASNLYKTPRNLMDVILTKPEYILHYLDNQIYSGDDGTANYDKSLLKKLAEDPVSAAKFAAKLLELHSHELDEIPDILLNSIKRYDVALSTFCNSDSSHYIQGFRQVMKYFRDATTAGRNAITQDKIIKNKGFRNWQEDNAFDWIPEKIYDVILAYFIDQQENKI